MYTRAGRYSRSWFRRLVCRLFHKKNRIRWFVLKGVPHEYCSKCGAFRKRKR